MNKQFTNQEVAEVLRAVSAAYSLLGKNRFEIIAYDNAADSVEHATDEVQQIWADEGKIELPGVGKSLGTYLGELFEKGSCDHFDQTLEKFPKELFRLLKIPSVGPKTALKLVELGVIDVEDLEAKLNDGSLVAKGFSEKIGQNILQGISEIKKRSDRILLSKAKEIADELIDYLKGIPEVKEAYAMGSSRRKVVTVGDLDLGVASTEPGKVVERFLSYKRAKKIESGDKSATIAMANGIRVDLLVENPANFGNLLQHFTGSQAHNVHFRTLAKKKGYVVSEYGIRPQDEKADKGDAASLIKFKTEKEVYEFFDMDYVEPELREDSGEIEAALKHDLPKTIELTDLKGDLHTHSAYSTDASSTVKEMVAVAKHLKYEYMVITDHSYPSLDFKKRLKDIADNSEAHPDFHIVPGLEVNININSTMQVPDEILQMHSWNTASIHTGFNQNRDEITARFMYALEHPYIEAISHPTGRLIGQRNGYQANWEKLFETAVKNGKYIEIDGYPNRSDLPDNLIREAIKYGVKFVLNSDAHIATELPIIEYGIYTAKRGWATKEMVINTLPWEKFKELIKR